MEKLYKGCPVQHARQFIAGKWQMGILWNLKKEGLCFSELKTKLPGISDKILMQELNYFLKSNMIIRSSIEFLSSKSKYILSPAGQSLIPVITTVVEWGYLNLQDENVNRRMNLTPLSVINAIEENK